MRKILLIILLLLLPFNVSATFDPLTDSEMAKVEGQAGLTLLLIGSIVDFGFAEAFNGEEKQERVENKEIILGIPEKYTDILNAFANIEQFLADFQDRVVKTNGLGGTIFIGGMPHHYIGILHMTPGNAYYEKVNQVVNEASVFILGY